MRTLFKSIFAFFFATISTFTIAQSLEPQLVSDVHNAALGSKVKIQFIDGDLIYVIATVKGQNGLHCINTKDSTMEHLGNPGSYTRFFKYRDTTYFDGYSLFKTDGTTAGTQAVMPDFGEQLYDSANKRLFFSRGTDKEGVELWVTSGSLQEGKMVKDIYTGSVGSYPSGLTMYKGEVYFFARNSQKGSELWKSDGTTGGTKLVKDCDPGSASESKLDLQVYKDKLFFVKRNKDYRFYLWESDGSETGTHYFYDRDTNIVNAESLVQSGGILFYSRYNKAEGWEIGRTDGTADWTFSISAIPGPLGTSVDLFAFNNKVYFSSRDGYGDHLYESDGTQWGTKMAYDDTALLMPYRSAIAFSDTGVYFSAGPKGTDAQYELYKLVNGKAVLVKNIIPDGGTYEDNRFVQELRSFKGSQIVFAADDGNHGYELWISDGTNNGTTLLKDVNPTTGGLGSGVWIAPTKHGVVMNGNDEHHQVNSWVHDRTQKNMHYLADEQGSPVEVNVRYYATAPHGTYFPTSFRTKNGGLMFFSNQSGRIKEINIPTGDENTVTWMEHMPASGKLFFMMTYRNKDDRDIWVYNESTQSAVKIITMANSGNAYEPPFRVVGNKAFLVAEDASTGRELYVTDGTPAGTKLLTDMSSHKPGSWPYTLTAFGDKILYTADTEKYGYELIMSDGTTAGTDVVKYISYNSHQPSIEHITVGDGIALFDINNNIRDHSVWVTDGTEEGTKELITVVKNSGGIEVTSIHYNPTLKKFFMNIEKGVYGHELWISDGTKAGTKMLKDISPGTGHGYPSYFINSDSLTYFSAWDLDHGGELWRTDGTHDGTVLHSDICIGKSTSRPQHSVKSGEYMYFIAEEAKYGKELWSMRLNCNTSEILGVTKSKNPQEKYTASGMKSENVTYQWTVTGGDIIAGQGTREITVKWTAFGDSATVELFETFNGNCAGETSSVVVDLSDLVSVEDIIAEQIVYVWPNPSSHSVSWTVQDKFLEGTFSVKDMLGRTVFSQNISNKQGTAQCFDLPGLYVLQWEKDGQVVTKKVLITQGR